MDFKEIEELVILCQSGDKEAKELLVKELIAMARNIASKYKKANKIDEYEVDDLTNQCLFKAFYSIDKYVPGNNVFIGYAKRAMINAMEDIGREVGTKGKVHGFQTLIIDDIVENTLSYDIDDVEDKLYEKGMKMALRRILKDLDEEEAELVDFIFYKKNTVKNYSRYKNISYMQAIRFKNKVLFKLKDLLKEKGYTSI